LEEILPTWVHQDGWDSTLGRLRPQGATDRYADEDPEFDSYRRAAGLKYSRAYGDERSDATAGSF
jgi:hypothetical protein